MIDQFSRRIEYARISVTDRCNLRCRYCMPESGVEKIPHAEILTFEEIARVAEIFARLGIKKIRITGGEPLLRKNLPELIRAIKKISGIEQVALTTNGVLLATQAKNLAAAGLDAINLSLDTLDAKTFAGLTRRNLFDNVRAGLQTLLDENFTSVKINCVPIRGVNDDDILSLVELARDKPVKVRFIELMPLGCAKNSGLLGIPTAEIFARIEKVFGTLTPVDGKIFLSDPARYFLLKDFRGQIGFIDALEHKFCSSCNRIRLTVEGFLKLCLNFDDGLDLKKILRNGAGDEEIYDAVERAIYSKPREHFFNVVGKIRAICISERRGTAKKSVSTATLHVEFGIVGDAHAGLHV